MKFFFAFILMMFILEIRLKKKNQTLKKKNKFKINKGVFEEIKEILILRGTAIGELKKIKSLENNKKEIINQIKNEETFTHNVLRILEENTLNGKITKSDTGNKLNNKF